MSGIMTYRAKRFHALHDLLTGHLPDQLLGSQTHLSEDIGLPAPDLVHFVVGPLGTLIKGAGR